jgi:hypothetical protein
VFKLIKDKGVLSQGILRLFKGSTMASIGASRKLILHFDVNETIMVGDPAGGDTFEESLNKCICKNAFIKLKDGVNYSSVNPANGGDQERWSNYTWHDGSPLDPKFRTGTHSIPPPLITSFDAGDASNICVYKTPEFKSLFAKSFTEGDSPGVIYRDLYEKIESAMRIPEGCDIDPRLTHDGVHFLVSY